MFVVKIKTDNAAFEGFQAEIEIARILRALAALVEKGRSVGIIRDVNGNQVGEYG